MLRLPPIRFWRNIGIVVLILCFCFTIVGTVSGRVTYRYWGAKESSNGTWFLWFLFLATVLLFFSYPSLMKRTSYDETPDQETTCAFSAAMMGIFTDGIVLMVIGSLFPSSPFPIIGFCLIFVILLLTAWVASFRIKKYNERKSSVRDGGPSDQDMADHGIKERAPADFSIERACDTNSDRETKPERGRLTKSALIVVDYQKDFVNGNLGFPKAETLDKAIAAKIRDRRSAGSDIIVTLDTHAGNYLKTQEGKNLPVIHCIRGTEGWSLFGETAKQIRETDRKFEKGTFGSLALAEYLKEQRYDIVELAGVVSNICVISNAVLAKAALPEALIIVDAACTASNDDTMNEKALDVMEGLQIEVFRRTTI